MGRKAAQGSKIGAGALGRALAKHKKQAKQTKSTNLQFQGQHVTEIHDSTTERLKSVIDRNALDDFLSDAILKETQFEAEKQQFMILGKDAIQGPGYEREGKQMTDQERMEKGQIYDYEIVPIPRRPRWSATTSADELDRLERESFLEWRRTLAMMEEQSGVNREITPFERNLDVWRQLWRVIERSDIVVQIVDARNPLLYRSQDLEAYVKEIGNGQKHCMLVVNKADFLSEEARIAWDRYFRSKGIDYVFFSAYQQQKRLDQEARIARGHVQGHRHGHVMGTVEERIQQRQQQEKEHVKDSVKDDLDVDKTKQSFQALQVEDEEEAEVVDEEEEEDEQHDDNDDDEKTDATSSNATASSTSTSSPSQTATQTSSYTSTSSSVASPSASTSSTSSPASTSSTSTSTSTSTPSSTSTSTSASASASASAFASASASSLKLLSHEELLAYITQQYEKLGLQRPAGTRITVGMVGYPNVGKSSTINVLVGAKKVSVGATPGKTKHFQTLMIGDDICVCDCPGLVFPTFLSSRAELVTNGVLPIDEMKDIQNYVEPVEVVCRKISRAQLAHAYSLIFPDWKPVTAMDLLQGHARVRGYMKDHGRPDESKSARMILKDYVLGRLLYCQPPPGLTSEERLAFYASYRYEDGSLAVKVSREDDEMWESQQSQHGKLTLEQLEAALQRQRERHQAKKQARKQAQATTVAKQMAAQQQDAAKIRQMEDREAGIVDEDDDGDVTTKSMMAIRKAEKNNGLKVNRMVLSHIEDSSPQYIDEMGRLGYKPEKLSAKQQLRQKQRYRKTGGQAKVNKFESPLHEMGFAAKGNSADAARRMGVSQPPTTI